MKKLCIAVVVLSLVSVCWSAPLTCEKLVKPVDKGPDLTGRWHYIALSSKVCLASVLLNTFIWPSVVLDITSTETPNLYNANIQFKIYGYCFNNSELVFYKNHSTFYVGTNNVPIGNADVLLHTSCPDCIVAKAVNSITDDLVIISRREAITDAELKEFEMQARCFGFSKPQVLNTDFDYENCKTPDSNMSEDEASTLRLRILLQVFERVKTLHHSIISCIIEMFLIYLPVTFER